MSILNVVSMTSTHFCARADKIQSARTVLVQSEYITVDLIFQNCACSFLCAVISKDMLLLLYSSKYGSNRFLRNVEYVY